MKNEINKYTFKDPLINNNENFDYNYQDEDIENDDKYKTQNFKYSKHTNDFLQNNLKVDDDKFINFNRNNTIINNKEESSKRFNNKKVKNTLNDIYGVIANINEVNKKVNNILSKRPNIKKYKSFDYKTKSIREEEDDIKKIRSTTEDKTPNVNNYIKESSHKDYSSPTTDTNFMASRTTADFYSSKTGHDIIIMNDDEDNDICLRNNKNNDFNLKYQRSYNMPYKKRNYKKSSYRINNYYNIPRNRSENLTCEYYTPTVKSNSGLKLLIQKNINRKISNNYSGENQEESIDITLGKLSNKSKDINNISDISNIEVSSNYFGEDISNEKEVKVIKLQLKNEENKLKELEKEKNKLLNEEKKRRKILMQKHIEQTKIKNKSLISEYKKKIKIIKKLQNFSKNEIAQLEKKKRLDEKKLEQINKICNDDDINKNIIKIKKNNHKYQDKQNSMRNKKFIEYKDNDLQNNKENINNNHNINDGDSFSNNNLTKKENNRINDYINDVNKEDLTENNKRATTLYDLTTSNNSNANISILTNESSKRGKRNNPKKLFNNLNINENYKNIIGNKYINSNKLYNDNNNDISIDIYNKDNKSIGLTDYLNQHNKYSYSQSRKYANRKNNNYNTQLYKTKSASSNFGIPSFIQSRVNKYNYNLSRDSSFSQRVSANKMVPYSLRYNINYKYHYPSKIPHKSHSNYYSLRNDSKDSKLYDKTKKDLNYKSIFFIDE